MNTSNLNVPFQLSKEEDDYVPDTLKDFLAEADDKIDQALSDEDNKNRDGTYNDNMEDDDDGSDTMNKSNDRNMNMNTPSKKLNSHTKAMQGIMLLSPGSDIDGPFDTDMGSACRPNPAELYITASEAKDYALDDRPGVCPDHTDDCNCHYVRRIAGVPVFDLEGGLAKYCPKADDGGVRTVSRSNSKEEEDGTMQELRSEEDEQMTDASLPEIDMDANASSNQNEKDSSRDMDDLDASIDRELSAILSGSTLDEKNDRDNERGDLSAILSGSSLDLDEKDAMGHKKDATSDEGSSSDHKTDGEQSSNNSIVDADEAFLPQLPASQDTDLSFGSEGDITDDDDDINSFLPNSGRGSIADVSTRLFTNDEQQQSGNANVTSRKMVKPKERAPPPPPPTRGKSKAKPKPIPRPKPQASPRRNFLKSKKNKATTNAKTKTTDTSNQAEPSKPKTRRFPLTFPRSPGIRNRRKYLSEPAFERERDDVPLKIEWSNDEGPLNPTSSMNDTTASAIGLAKPPKKEKKKKKLTIPKTPFLLSKQKRGERKYSSIGLAEDKVQESAYVPANNDWKNRELTKPKSPGLLSKKKHGDKRYSNVGARDKKVDVDIPNHNIDWKNKQPTVPKSPLLSFFIKKNKAIVTKPEEVKDSAPSKSTFKAKPVPAFPEPNAALKGKRQKKRPLTVPKPFHFATTERASSPERRKLATKYAEKESNENVKEAAAVFKARPAPDFSRPTTVPVKTVPRPLTVPKPFNFVTDERASSPSVRRLRQSRDYTGSGDGLPVAPPFKAKPVPDFSRPSLVQPKTSARPLTVPKPFNLVTNERASSPSVRKTMESFEISFQGKDEKATSTTSFKARPAPDFSSPSLFEPPVARQLTVPKPFNLVTDERASSPSMRRIRESMGKAGNAEKEATTTSFKARPAPDFTSPSLVQPAARPPTVLKPFNLTASDKASSPTRKARESTANAEKADKEASSATVFKARPVPDFSRSSLPQPKKSYRRITVPKIFTFASDERASSPSVRSKGSVDDKMKKPVAFKARPVPNFSQPSLLQPKKAGRPLTIPKPFHLATNERASSPSVRKLRESLEGAKKDSTEGKDAKFKARPVPNFSQTNLVKPKKSVRPMTVPKPFHLSTDERAISPRRLKNKPLTRKGRSKERDTSSSVQAFKARPAPDFSRHNVVQPKFTKHPTIPKPFQLATAKRSLSPRSRNLSTNKVTKSKLTGGAAKVHHYAKPDEVVVFRAKPMPNFSRNPNSHRKNLVKRAVTKPVPFRLVSDELANSPYRVFKRKSAMMTSRTSTPTYEDEPSSPQVSESSSSSLPLPPPENERLTDATKDFPMELFS